MPSPQLPNYLRLNRRRLNLSQKDIAFLLGKRRKGDVSRYERFDHLPNLETALAYEAIFNTSVSELFAGIYQKIELETVKRRRLLAEQKGKVAGRRPAGKEPASPFSELNP